MRKRIERCSTVEKDCRKRECTEPWRAFGNGDLEKMGTQSQHQQDWTSNSK